MIEISNLSYAYGNNTVLENITMKLRPGHVYGLLGENGVGKTTLLTLLAGLKAPKAGLITVDGIAPCDRKPSYLSDLFYLPDEVIPLRLSAERFAAERGYFWPKFSMDKYIDLLREFEVNPDQRMDQMSAGQLKKTWIAFGMACHARYIYMDEPTNGLDIPSKSQMRRIIARETTDDSTVIISTHQVRDLEDSIDAIVILETRQVAVNASMEEIARKFWFDYGPSVRNDSLYMEPVAGGIIQVVPNTEGLDSKVNLEVFFNAVHSNRERVLEILSNPAI